MKSFLCVTLLVVLGGVPVMAQSALPTADKVPEKARPTLPTGVLIGLDRLYDSQIPRSEILPSLEDKKSAAYQRQWSENKDAGETRIVRYDTTPEESPYATIWLQWAPGGAKVRVLRDIILPRKDGFWRFGINHSSVNNGFGNDDEDFFWLAPLGAMPALTRADDIISGSQASTRRLTYIGPDYFGYRELGHSWGGTYGEGESASVRALDEFAKAPPKQADYDYDHPGLALGQVLGPGAEAEFEKIAKEIVPKESGDTQSGTPAATENEDPCAGSGYETSKTDWYSSHKQDRWLALLGLQNTGPGICNRRTDWRPLAHRLPPKFAGNNPIPIPWAQVEKTFPGARHAFASPKGDWLVVLTRNRVYFAPLSGGSIGKTVGSVEIPYGIPVMVQWAVGKYVALWDQQFSKLPPPNDDVIFTDASDMPD